MTKQDAIDHFNLLVQHGASTDEFREAEAAIAAFESHPVDGNAGQNHD